MFFLYPTTRTPHHERGFTLVEVMVAMVIAMLGVIIMMQMYATFEGRKRTTAGGDDAMNAGSIAMYGIQLNIEQAGYCFVTSGAAPTISTGDSLNGVTGATLLPVMIDVTPLATSAVRDVNTNTLLVAYGNDACEPESASGVANAANTVNVLAYAVKGGNLMQCDYVNNDCKDPTKWELIAGDVVSMRAECSANKGVLVALVTRSRQLEHEVATSSVPGWSGTGAIDLSQITTDAAAAAMATRDSKSAWQYYRYKTFETVAPIRNAIWTGATGC